MLLALPGSLSGQNTDEDPATEAQLLASAPAAGTSAASLTFGLQIQDGRTETRGFSAAGTWARASQARSVVRLDASLKRASYRSSPSAERVTIEDTQTLMASLVHPVTGPLSFLSTASWRRDAPVKLDYRVMLQAGLGYSIHRDKKILFTIGPVVGVGQQDNALSDGGDRILNVGGIQSLSWHVTPTFGIENTFAAYRDVDNADDHSIDASLSATARIARRIGMKLSYTYLKEGIHPPFVSAVQKEFEAGVTITLLGG